MAKHGSSFQNAFAALSGVDAEEDPHNLLSAQPSRRAQKKAEHQARQVLEVGGWTTVQQKPKRKQQQQHWGSNSRVSLDSTDSLQAALEAIAAAEQHQPQQEAWQQPQQQRQHQQGLDSADSLQAALEAIATAEQHQQHQQQPQPQEVLNSTAACWQHFALTFAAAARDCGDDDAADNAVKFGLSAIVDLVAIASDDAALLELGGVADEAAAAGVSVEELLQAQQAELLLQANTSSRHKTSWPQVQLEWAGSAGSTSPVQQQQQQWGVQPPEVHCPQSFPSLEAPAAAAAGGGGWQTAGRSPHSVSRHWRGGRSAPKVAASGIKLVRTADAAGGASTTQRPQHALELHWDLVLDGLVLKERDSLDDAGGLSTAADFHDGDDPWEAVLAAEAAQAVAGGDDRLWRRYAEEAAAVQRTRDLLTGQEEAAAAAAAVGGASSSRDRLGQDRVRRMMESAAAKRSGARLATAVGDDDDPASSCGSGSEDAAAGKERSEQQQRQQGGGAKNLYGYSWASIFKAALAGGWVPVHKLDGGGGSHFKLRRVLPVSGQTQTLMLACTPSDTARGPRNAAASLLRKDEERERLEEQAVAAAKQTAPAAANSSSGKGKGTKQRQKR